MASSETSIQQLAEAARSMQDKDSTLEMLDEAVGAATEIIEGCDLAGMSIVNPYGIDTPAGSGAALRRIDELQFELHEGPCFDALRLHEVVLARNLATDERWPTWGPRVVEEIGVHSIVSYRLFTTKDALGAMNLYSHSLDAFDDDDIANGGALAAHVAVALADAQNVAHLETAIGVRTDIGRAEGILMERFDLSETQAFAVLRRVSQDRNIKLNRVAADLVRTRKTPT
ncbi:MAG: GAF and ANTAR domain-containing protein [Microbacteriaceae bacterium]